MPDEINIKIVSSFDPKGATDAQKAIAGLGSASKSQPAGAGSDALSKAAVNQAQALSKVEVAAARVAQAQQRVETEEQKTATAANVAATAQQRLSTEEQRTAQAAAQAAAAQQRLATEEQRTAVAAAQAAAAQARAQQATVSLAQAQERAANGGSGLSQSLGGIQGTLSGVTSALGAVGVGFGVMQIAQGAFDLAKTSAGAEAARVSFDALAKSAGTTGNALLGQMRAAAQGTISDANLIQSANTGLLLTSGKIGTELPKLLEIARASAKATGQDVGFVFDSLVRGIARGSPMIIDNAGITLNASQAFETYAASIGKTPEQLTKAEQQQATLNAVVAAGSDIIAKTGGAAETNATKFAILSTGVENAKDAIGGLLAQDVGSWAQNAGNALNNLAGSLNQLKGGKDQGQDFNQKNFAAASKANDFSVYEEQIKKFDAAVKEQTGGNEVAEWAVRQAIGLQPLTKAQFDYAQSLIQTGATEKEAFAAAQSQSGTAQALAESQRQLAQTDKDRAAGLGELAPKILAVSAANETDRANVAGLLDAYLSGTLSADAFGSAMDQLAARQQSQAAGAAAVTAAINGQVQAMLGLASSATAATGPSQEQALAMVQAAAAGQLYTDAQGQVIAVTQESANQTLLDATAKQQAAAQSALMEAQTRTLGDSFLALNPNISQSGVASAVASGQISSAVGAYIAMTLGIANARAQLAALQAQAGMAVAKGPVKAGGTLRADQVLDRAQGSDTRSQQVTQRLQNERKEIDRNQKAEAARAAAQRNQIMQTGTAAQKQQQLNKELATARSLYGANSAEAINAQTAVTAFEQSQEKAGAKGRKARVGAAQKAGNQLASIEQSTGTKLADLDRATQEKLIAFDQRAAEQRAAAARKLAEDVLSASADMVAEQESNDLELIGAKGDQLKELQIRESAEAKARVSMLEAVSEAQKRAADGDADTADKVLSVRENQISQQQKLDEEYAKKQAELGKDQGAQAALKQQYDEATAAIQQSADVRIQLADAAAQQEAGKAAAERDAIVGAAEDQRVQVIAKAQDQAMNVKGASDSQTSAVISNATRQRDQAIALAQQMRDGINTAVAGINTPTMGVNGGGGSGDSGGSSTPAPAAGGGGTSGGSTNKGTFGKPATRAAGPVTRAGSVTEDPFGSSTEILAPSSTPPPPPQPGKKPGKKPGKPPKQASVKEQIDAANQAIDLLNAMAELAEKLAEPRPVISADYATSLARDVATVTRIVTENILPITKQIAEKLKLYKDQSGDAISILGDVQDLREKFATPQPALDPIAITYMAGEMRGITRIIVNQIEPLSAEQAVALNRYAQNTENAVKPLAAVQDLRENLAKPQPVLDAANLLYLAGEMRGVTRIILGQIETLSATQASALEQYATNAENAVKPLQMVAELRDKLKEPAPPLDPQTLIYMAGEIRGTTRIILSQIEPSTETQNQALDRYANEAGNAVGILGDVADLRDKLKDPQPPLDAAALARLASEANQATQIVRGALLPTTEEQRTAIGLYADAAGSSLGLLKDTLDLSGKLFVDYTSPTDADLSRVARDADRVVRFIADAAATYDTKGLQGAKLYNDAVDGMFGSLTDGLKFFDILGTGEFILDPAKLAQFQDGVAQTLAVASTLGAQAAAIPAGNLAALERANTLLNGLTETAIKMTAIPFADLPAAAQNLSAYAGALQGGTAGGGGGDIYIQAGAIVIQGAGQNADALATQVLDKFTQMVRSRK